MRLILHAAGEREPAFDYHRSGELVALPNAPSSRIAAVMAVTGARNTLLRVRRPQSLVECADSDQEHIEHLIQAEHAPIVGTSGQVVTRRLRCFHECGRIDHEMHSFEIHVCDRSQLTPRRFTRNAVRGRRG